MAKYIAAHGIDDYIAKLEDLGRTSWLRAAVYDGAAVYADAVREELRRTIQNDPEHTRRQLGALLDSMFVADIQTVSGYTFTEVGFAGYDAKGSPNIVKVRSMEHGNSNGQKKTAPLRKAANRTKQEIIKAMADKVDEMMTQIMQGD